MEIVDCKWEIQNIHKKTIEITVERGDIFGDMNLPPVTTVVSTYLGCTFGLSQSPLGILRASSFLPSLILEYA